MLIDGNHLSLSTKRTIWYHRSAVKLSQAHWQKQHFVIECLDAFPVKISSMDLVQKWHFEECLDVWKVIWSLNFIIHCQAFNQCHFWESFSSQNMHCFFHSVSILLYSRSLHNLCKDYAPLSFFFLNKYCDVCVQYHKKTWRCWVLSHVLKKYSQASRLVVLEWAYVGILVPLCNLEPVFAVKPSQAVITLLECETDAFLKCGSTSLPLCFSNFQKTPH